MGKELTDVNIMENMDVNAMKKNSGTKRNPGKETANQKKIPAEQRSLKEILDKLADDEFIVTVPIGKEDEENE